VQRFHGKLGEIRYFRARTPPKKVLAFQGGLHFFRSASHLHKFPTDSAKGHGRVCGAGRDEVEVSAWIRPTISDNAFVGINYLTIWRA